MFFCIKLHLRTAQEQIYKLSPGSKIGANLKQTINLGFSFPRNSIQFSKIMALVYVATFTKNGCIWPSHVTTKQMSQKLENFINGKIKFNIFAPIWVDDRAHNQIVQLPFILTPAYQTSQRPDNIVFDGGNTKYKYKHSLHIP